MKPLARVASIWMSRLGRFSNSGPRSAILVLLTLAIGGVFKLSAFAREAFIAAHFGLSAVTDLYFGLQQFPISLSSFMFGAFSLAFAPAYAKARRSGTVTWLPGLLVYGCLFGGALTVAMLAAAPWLLQLLAYQSPATWNTLAILSACFIPIVCIGIWSGICVARGRNLWAMSMTGFPYLAMTLALLALYAVHAMNNQALAISMTIGFGVVGAYSFVRILVSLPRVVIPHLLSPWNASGFRPFLRDLGASSLENAGFAVNQMLILYCLASAGTGAISANSCGMRIGLLGFSLLALPLAQLFQARLCVLEPERRAALFGRWIFLLAIVVVAAGLGLFILRVQIVQLVYMHGRFKDAELNKVVAILPAWIGYFIVMSINALIARFLFTSGNGSKYTRSQLAAYAGANVVRLAGLGVWSAPAVIWCSVVAESCALLWNLQYCFARRVVQSRPVILSGSSEVFDAAP